MERRYETSVKVKYKVSFGTFLQQSWGDGLYCSHCLCTGGINQGFRQQEPIVARITQLKSKGIWDPVLIGPVYWASRTHIWKRKTLHHIWRFDRCWYRNSHESENTLASNSEGMQRADDSYAVAICHWLKKRPNAWLTKRGGGRAVSVSHSISWVQSAHCILGCWFLREKSRGSSIHPVSH